MAETRNVGPGSGGIGSAIVSMTATATPTEGGALNFVMPTFINANSCIERRYTLLSSGETEVVIPDTAFCVFILPSSSNAVSIGVHGATGDTPIALAPTGGCMLTFAAGASRSLFVTTGADVTVTLMFF